MKKTVLLIMFPSLLIFADSPQNIVSSVCSECHGSNMGESGMSVSRPPNTLAQPEILEALRGYKKGLRSQYGMGSTMNEKVSNYSDGTLEELSKYIPTLK